MCDKNLHFLLLVCQSANNVYERPGFSSPDLVLDMKQTKITQLVIENIKIINIGDHLMDNIHHQSGVVIKQLMKSFFIISINLTIIIYQNNTQFMMIKCTLL